MSGSLENNDNDKVLKDCENLFIYIGLGSKTSKLQKSINQLNHIVVFSESCNYLL